MEHWAAAAAAAVENCHGDTTTARNKQPDFHISNAPPLVADALIVRVTWQIGKEGLEKSMCISLASVALNIAQCVPLNNATCVLPCHPFEKTI